jgi:TPP-dependent pyruvate/acetoin dehydrogenase alpha subunit
MAVKNVAVAPFLPCRAVDGNDILAVHESVRKAIERARAGQGPSLIECLTFRMTGHSAHDDAGYVPKELLEEWEARDPIRRYEQVLVGERILKSSDCEWIRRSVVEEVDRAVEWAEQSPYPDPQDCLLGVYHE